MHACEGDLVCKATNDKVPFTNAFIFNEQKAQIGKVDEVLGPMTEVVCFYHLLVYSSFSEFLFSNIVFFC